MRLSKPTSFLKSYHVFNGEKASEGRKSISDQLFKEYTETPIWGRTPLTSVITDKLRALPLHPKHPTESKFYEAKTNTATGCPATSILKMHLDAKSGSFSRQHIPDGNSLALVLLDNLCAAFRSKLG